MSADFFVIEEGGVLDPVGVAAGVRSAAVLDPAYQP